MMEHCPYCNQPIENCVCPPREEDEEHEEDPRRRYDEPPPMQAEDRCFPRVSRQLSASMV
jgi:hypothetical protein